jgi:thiol-disulfide isomerase/thioredoxin
MLTNLLAKIRANPMSFALMLVTVAILIAASLYVFQSMKPDLTTQLEPGETSNVSSSEAEIIFFYANWCPHCKAAMPHWDEVKKQYDGKTINGYMLVFTKVDCSEETSKIKKLTDEYDVEGYPTIKLVKNGEVIEYDAKPTKDTLEKFINSVL